jgi:DNA helicase-2/ATP-dependent DNA helicase PcrA
MSRIADRQAAWRPEGITLEPAALAAAKSTAHTLVIAGPGAGKTELLAQRACYLLQTGTCPAPYRILAISFKREAAENLKDRVILRCGRELGARMDSFTFDAFAKDLLDRFRLLLPAEYRPTADYTILTGSEVSDTRMRDRMNALSLVHLPMDQHQRAQIQGSSLNQALAVMALPTSEWPPRPALMAATGLWRGLLAERPSQLTFRMMNRLTELLVRTDESLRTALRDTYRFVFLDEFQDTTSGQFELAETCFFGSHSILTAVGDNKQRIMGWAGALEGVSLRFKDEFGAGVETLTQNHRSRSRLVEIQSLFATELDPEAVLTASARTGDATGECRVLEFPQETAEAEHVTAIIKELTEAGVPPEEICILCRARPDQFAANVITSLKDAGLKVRVEINRREILGEPVSSLLVGMLALMFNVPAPEAWIHVGNVATELAGDPDESSANRTRRRLLIFLETEKSKFELGGRDAETVRPALDRLLAFFDRERFSALHPQYAQGDYLSEVLDRLADLIVVELAECDWEQVVPAVQGVGAISVMTMHKSKGLEFDTVFFLGLEDSSIWNYLKNPNEETCGLFVALSRAKERCYFTFCRSRINRFGNPETQRRLSIKRIFELFQEAGVKVEKID